MKASIASLSIGRSPAVASSVFIWAGLAICAALQLHLVFTQPVNWDEFRFLSDIYAYRDGSLSTVVQTFHVHLFGWLAGSFADEIDQVIAGRLVMMALEGVTLALIFRICRCFTSREAALFAVLAFLSFSFVLKHGASFRYDPIATALLTGAAAILLTSRLHWVSVISAGAAIGLAAIVTIKSVLFLPLFAGLAGWRLWKGEHRRDLLIRLTVMGLTSAGVLLLLYIGHRNSMLILDDAQAAVAGSAQKTLGEGRLFPRYLDFARSVMANPIHWVLLVLGVVSAIRQRLWISLAFLLPLASLIFYRNAFPYFYGFMLAPASVFFAMAVSRLDLARFLTGLSAALTALAMMHSVLLASPALGNQRTVLAAARSIFPAQTAYVDRASMLASTPQAGFFMSSWGIENYRAAGEPLMRNAIADKGARYLIANHPQLELALSGSENVLLPDDAYVLHIGFIPHWGPIWVLGTQLSASNIRQQFEIFASGAYTIEGKGPVRIDGVLRQPGEVVSLDVGEHMALAPSAATLRWGDHLHRPVMPPPSGPLFTDL